MPVFNSTNN